MSQLELLQSAQTAVNNAIATLRNSRHAHIELSVASLRVSEALEAERARSQ